MQLVEERDPEADLDMVARGNGFRVFMDGSTLVVQHLRNGWWVELPTTRVRPGRACGGDVRAVRGGVASVRRHARLWRLVSDDLEALGAGGRLMARDLAKVLVAGDGEEPSFPVPTPRQIRKAADRCIFQAPEESEIRAVAAVASMIACCGGMAPVAHLQRLLRDRLGSWEMAERALSVALRLGKFRRVWSGGTAFVQMWADWEYFERVPTP